MARLADPGLATRRRREILDAALFCFRRRGFHQATMQEICAEAGLSPGALYRYFNSKADIIAAIAEDERSETDLVLRRASNTGELIDGAVTFLPVTRVVWAIEQNGRLVEVVQSKSNV